MKLSSAPRPRSRVLWSHTEYLLYTGSVLATHTRELHPAFLCSALGASSVLTVQQGSGVTEQPDDRPRKWWTWSLNPNGWHSALLCQESSSLMSLLPQAPGSKSQPPLTRITALLASVPCLNSRSHCAPPTPCHTGPRPSIIYAVAIGTLPESRSHYSPLFQKPLWIRGSIEHS